MKTEQVVFGGGLIDSEDGPEHLLDVSAFPTLEELERQYLTLVLKKTAGSKPEAAKILGVTVKTVYNKLENYAADTKAAAVTEQN